MEEPCENNNRSDPAIGGLVRRTVALASEPSKPSGSEGKPGMYRRNVCSRSFADCWIGVFDRG